MKFNEIEWESEYPTEEELEEKLKQSNKELDRQIAAQQKEQVQETYQDNQEPSLIETVNSVVAEDEDNDEELLNNADLRLEQGKLYQMLLKHDIFGEIDADPIAVKNVQKELKKFIKDRLNILLGLKQDPSTVTQIVQVESQFTPEEVDLLKRVVAKALNGSSENVKPLQTAVPAKKIQLNTLSSIQKQPQVKQKPIEQKPKQNPQPKPSQPIKKEQEPVVNKSREEYLYSKPLNELTQDEKIERNQIITEKQKRMQSQGKGIKRPPMPSLAEQEMLYLKQASSVSSGKNIVSSILGKLRSDGNLE